MEIQFQLKRKLNLKREKNKMAFKMTTEDKKRVNSHNRRKFVLFKKYNEAELKKYLMEKEKSGEKVRRKDFVNISKRSLKKAGLKY